MQALGGGSLFPLVVTGDTGPDEDPEDEFGSLAPQVVAVVVACDPGEWFEEGLAALASSDYPELSVLVIDAGREVVAERVAAALPGAYVRRLARNAGFGASANAVLGMVEGASHFLFCHDDVAPERDAVSALVEESFRSNAGVVAPKLVSWEDPRRLLHVGMAADKFGAVVDRVGTGEIDHGQHDSVRDVFLTTGGCTLVRADLFAELGGFDPQMFAMGEHLDLCWRAQVAGARVVVTPMARVRHLELIASGHRELPVGLRTAMPVSSSDGGDERSGVEAEGASRHSRLRRALVRGPRKRTQHVTLQALERRHEMRAVLKNYGRFHRARVLPQMAILSVAEILIGWLTGHRDRAAAVIHAWRWNFTERSSLRVARARVQSTRLLDDASIRRLQLRGSARFNAFLRRAVTHGVSAARLGELEEISDLPMDRAAARTEEQRKRVARDTRAIRGGMWLLMAVVLVFGTRDLVTGGMPYVGQFLPFASWSAFLHRFVSGWQPYGVGTVASATPGTGFLGLGGLVLFGGTGLLQKILVLGCVPVGGLGMSRLIRGLGSARARIVAAVLYLVVPLPYDAFANGRWDALLVYAACPWIVGRLARASGASGFETVASERTLPPWRRSIAGRALGLGVLEALLTSVAPTGAVLTLVVTVGLAIGSLVVWRGGPRSAGRIVAVGGGATLFTAVLLAPWSASVLVGPARWEQLFGIASLPSSGPSWGSLLHLGVGPIGDTPLAWGLLVAGALGLMIGTGPRLAWAGRAWVLAAVSWLLAWAGTRGWLGPFAVDALVLLVPAACAIAMAGGLGMAAFEEDLSRHRFGWRQASAVAAALFAALGTIPMLAASVSGRWDLPTSGYGQATSWMAHQTRGNFRVLWVGDPAVLPGGSGWQVAPGLAYSLSEEGLPDATAMWPGSSPGPATAIGEAVRLGLDARDRATRSPSRALRGALRGRALHSGADGSGIGRDPVAAASAPVATEPVRPGGPTTGDRRDGIRRLHGRRRTCGTRPSRAEVADEALRRGDPLGMGSGAERTTRGDGGDRARGRGDALRRGCAASRVAGGGRRFEPAAAAQASHLRVCAELRHHKALEGDPQVRRFVVPRGRGRRGDRLVGLRHRGAGDTAAHPAAARRRPAPEKKGPSGESR